MSKKEKVRQHIETMQSGATFTVRSLAVRLSVETKDVSNVVAELKRLGIVESEVKQGNNHMTYTLVKNMREAVKLKKPILPPQAIKQDPPAKPYADPPKLDKPRAKPAKRRTPFVMAIDAEIKALELKVKNLRSVRKEFE